MGFRQCAPDRTVSVHKAVYIRGNRSSSRESGEGPRIIGQIHNWLISDAKEPHELPGWEKGKCINWDNITVHPVPRRIG